MHSESGSWLRQLSREGTGEYVSWGRTEKKRNLLRGEDSRDMERSVPEHSVPSGVRPRGREETRTSPCEEEGKRQTEPEEVAQSCLAARLKRTEGRPGEAPEREAEGAAAAPQQDQALLRSATTGPLTLPSDSAMSPRKKAITRKDAASAWF